MLITTLEAATLAVIAKTLRSLFRPEPKVPALMLAAIERLDVPPAYRLAGPRGNDLAALR